MEETFRSRLVDLMKKSRKAIRLYGSVYRTGEPSSRFAESQANEWKTVNSELLRLLSAALDHPNPKQLSSDIVAIRDRFEQDARKAEGQLHELHTRLINTSENGDYIKAALLSTELVVLKARMQAAQAAHHELADVVKRSKVVGAAIELPAAQVVEWGQVAEPEEVKPRLAKVIQLGRRIAG